MGQNFLFTGLWAKNGTVIDFEAGLAAADATTDEDLVELEAQIEGASDPDFGATRATLRAAVDDLRNQSTGFSRDLASVDTPDGEWTFYFTGGPSWGDTPNELYDTFDRLWCVPAVLVALGFNADRGDTAPEPTNAIRLVFRDGE